MCVFSCPALRFWLAFLVGVPAVLARSDYVVVSATASPGYDRTTADGQLRPESYIVSRGRQWGFTRDATLADDRFQDLLRVLAPALAKQEYWPAPDADQADLLIVVHWGETEIYDDPVADFMADNLNDAMNEYLASADEAGNADPGRLNELKAAQSTSTQLAQIAARQNAELLGYKQHLDEAEKRYFAGEDERTMKSELAENRYFVVLMAWDYAALRRNEPAHLRWVTRMNVRAVGHGFGDAMVAMVRQGAPLFGRQQDGLSRARVPIEGGRAEVEIGETTVVEDESEPPR